MKIKISDNDFYILKKMLWELKLGSWFHPDSNSIVFPVMDKSLVLVPTMIDTTIEVRNIGV